MVLPGRLYLHTHESLQLEYAAQSDTLSVIKSINTCDLCRTSTSALGISVTLIALCRIDQLVHLHCTHVILINAMLTLHYIRYTGTPA